VLADENGFLDELVVAGIAEQVTALRAAGKQVIVVSSGAGAAGASAAGLMRRREDMNYKQAICAVGQVELMMSYKRCFAEHGAVVGQLLLTRNNFDSHDSSLHIRNTLFTLVDEGFVPIINENDSVSVEEFTLGDNDTLAAMTANLWNASMLVLMTNVDGVFDRKPGTEDHLIHEVTDTARLLREVDFGGKSAFGTGGMVTKVEAAARVGEYGIPALVVNGKVPGVLGRIADGEQLGTLFLV
jgi:glutamate 5-kinase